MPAFASGGYLDLAAWNAKAAKAAEKYLFNGPPLQ